MCGSLSRRIRDCLSSRKNNRTRLVGKDGRCNIAYGNIKYANHYAFVADFWTTLVEIQWRYVLLFFIGSFTITWFLFALLWYWIAKNNGDLYWQNPSSDHKPCIWGVWGLTTAFLYSLETQTTIGYGVRAVTPYCPGGVALVTIQAVFGAFFNCFMCGLVMSKISSPKKRGKTITFSEMAVISPKNGSLCLSIRVANLRKSLMIGSQIYGKLLRTKNTLDGETVIIDQVNIDFMVDAGKDSLFFVYPFTLHHIIDKNSPFFEMTEDTLHKQDFELVVFLDGTAESTSSSHQVRTSFVPQEIMWGYDFLPIISKSKDDKYRVDFSNFSKVVPVTTAESTYCFYNISSHLPHPSDGYDNQGFEVIEIGDRSHVTTM
ncbi:ATP-sensitive inward rectifier potassium channel 1-like [Channa argus]|uniref:ATP-sensitive inward rectifier potassium channel 1-like n=1 Tax=Channa argus TaxID=215402 RepID=UPI0029464C2A|nr:hypothetical protein Q8A73_006832 [Channa argus]